GTGHRSSSGAGGGPAARRDRPVLGTSIAGRESRPAEAWFRGTVDLVKGGRIHRIPRTFRGADFRPGPHTSNPRVSSTMGDSSSLPSPLVVIPSGTEFPDGDEPPSPPR